MGPSFSRLDAGPSDSSLPEDMTPDGFLSALLTIVSPQTRPIGDSSIMVSTFWDDCPLIERILPPQDSFRLARMEAVYESNQGKLLAYTSENNTFSLVETVGNGLVPPHAMLPAPYSGFNSRLIFPGLLRTAPGHRCDCYVRGELSAELSKYIWHLDQDAIHVQYRSSVPSFRPLHNRLNVVFGNNGGGNDGEYCLAACNDGTVKWLPQSKCKKGGHIWTVHLFDSPSEESVHLCERLRRRGAIANNNNQVNVINNYYFGGNNNESGSQVIGTINYQTELNLNLPRTNLEPKE